MRMILMFDMPTDTKGDIKKYTKFRKKRGTLETKKWKEINKK